MSQNAPQYPYFWDIHVLFTYLHHNIWFVKSCTFYNGCKLLFDNPRAGDKKMRACKRDGDVCHAKKQEILFFFGRARPRNIKQEYLESARWTRNVSWSYKLLIFFYFFKLLMLICWLMIYCVQYNLSWNRKLTAIMNSRIIWFS